MSEIVILLGGDITPTDRLKAQVKGKHVIAADSGIRHAKTLGLEVHLWVGDFDSASLDDLAANTSISKEKWPKDKDLTDCEIAFAAAKRLGATSLILVGAFGGRSAHATNHMLMAVEFSGNVLLTSGVEEAVPITGSIEPDWPVGCIFSIVALDDLGGLTVTGVRWPLDHVNVAAGAGWTLSNVVEQRVSISLKHGRALAIAEF